MKKGTKIALIVAASLVVLGLIFCGVALAIVGGNWARLNASIGGEIHYEQKQYAYDADRLNRIVLNDIARDVLVTASPDDQIHVSCYDSEQSYYDLDLSDSGTLIVTLHTTGSQWIGFIGIRLDADEPRLEVSIPASYEGELKIKTASGNISASGTTLSELSASTTSGTVTFRDVSVSGTAVVSTTSGDFRAERLTAKLGLNCSTTSGDMRLQLQSVGTTSLSTTSGDITLSSAEAEGCPLSIDATSGDIEVTDARFGDVEIGTVSGEIVLSNVACQDVTLHTTSGDIEASLPDRNYKVQSQTTSGDMRLPESYRDGDYTIDVRTVSGDAEITLLG